MDAYSLLSKYHAETWICGYALLISPSHFPCLSFLRVLCSPFLPFSSTNSEEAKSTTWLHPVTGEAVITGHRKTPGKQSGNWVLFSPCENTRAHAAPVKGYPRVTAVEEKKGGRQVTGRAVEGDEGEISSLCSKATTSFAPIPFLLHSGGPFRTVSSPTATPHPHAPPGHFATHFLKVPSRRREPE